MPRHAARNSTNVRFYDRAAAPALLAFALWGGFIALLRTTGAFDMLATDMPWVAAFACGFAALAYLLDEELRQAMEAQGTVVLLAAFAASAVACALHAAVFMVFAPAAVLLAMALALRAARPGFSSAAAASPAARRGAP